MTGQQMLNKLKRMTQGQLENDLSVKVNGEYFTVTNVVDDDEAIGDILDEGNLVILCLASNSNANVVVEVNGGVADVSYIDDGIEVIIKDYDSVEDVTEGDYGEDEGGSYRRSVFGNPTGPSIQVVLSCRGGGVVDVDTCPDDIVVAINDND